MPDLSLCPPPPPPPFPQALMEKRVGPWINKKIVEYIGEEEPTLTELICNKVSTSGLEGPFGVLYTLSRLSAL